MDHCYVLLLLWSSVATGTQQEGDPQPAELVCPELFEDVGGRCLHFDNVNTGTWYTMRQICEGIGGDLIKLDSGDLYAAIMRHMHGNGWPDAYYWIGATDEGHEGVWTWTDGTSVQMGTPFWANYGWDNVQQPAGGVAQNCGLLDPTFHMYFNDLGCGALSIHAICES